MDASNKFLSRQILKKNKSLKNITKKKSMDNDCPWYNVTLINNKVYDIRRWKQEDYYQYWALQ